MVRRAIGIILFLTTVLNAQVVRPGIEAFNAGEVSPLFEARTGFAKYDNACRTLQNMLVLTQGPVTRRPGTKYIAEVKTSADYCRLIPFEYSKTDTYILEFGDLYLRVYRNGGQVLDGASPYELVTVFTDDELFNIQYVQSANIMYLVHADHPPQVLTRTGHTAWTIAEYAYTGGPFSAENETTTTIAPSAVTGAVTLTASVATFNVAGHPDSLWRIRHRVASASVSGTLDDDESSATLPIGGAFDFTTKGTWTGTVTLERNENGAGWEPTLGFKASVNDDNIDYSDTELDADVLYRATMSGYVSGDATYNLSAASYIHTGIVDVTAVATTVSASGTVVTDLASTDATTTWSEPAWSDYRGWSETVEFHEQRLVFGGNASYPQTVWFSKTGDENHTVMTEGTIDDDAFIYDLPGQNPIQWMLSQDYLMIGTLGGTGRLGNENTALTPSTPDYKTQSRPGSAYIQAVRAGDSTLYVERGGERVREIAYSLERDRFVAPDMNILAEHIADGGIVDIAYQARPDSILWCVRNDGTLLSLTYRREQEVIAWARHTTGASGLFESVAVIPSTGEDEVWVVVARTIDGSTVRYVEQFQPRDWGTDQADCYYVDSGLSFDGGSSVTITNITQANPAVVTVSSWPTDGDGTNLADGDQVRILSVVGMTEVNDNVYTVDDADSVSTFSLDDSASVGNITSTGFTAYVSGGTVQRVEKDFSGLTHLEGEEVTVFAGGGYLGTGNVTSGIVSVSEWVNTAHVGKEYTSILETMPIAFDARGSSIAPRLKKIASFTADVFETLGFYYGLDADNLTEMPEINSDSDPVPVYTGFKECNFPYGHQLKAVVYIQETRPIPLTIRALYPDLEIDTE